jgi:hypothetical protein
VLSLNQDSGDWRAGRGGGVEGAGKEEGLLSRCPTAQKVCEPHFNTLALHFIQ